MAAKLPLFFNITHERGNKNAITGLFDAFLLPHKLKINRNVWCFANYCLTLHSTKANDILNDNENGNAQ